MALDGLPCSGKTTFVSKLREHFAFECLELDEFVRPEKDWPSRTRPAFPFEYIRYDEFIGAVTSIARTGVCAYRPFDWETFAISSEPRELKLRTFVFVEGVSALHPALCDYYDLKIFIDSDRSSLWDAAKRRGLGPWATEWSQLFVPSADIYMTTRPQERADLIIEGRMT